MKKIIYDFDGTLTPFSLPKFEILEKCGMEGGASNPKFMELSREKLSQVNNDLYKAIYQTYFDIIQKNGFSLTNDNFSLGADKAIYNPGVMEFLKMLRENNVENYLLSSGLLVYLNNTKVAPLFEEIFATTFIYNEDGEVIDIDYLMSDKNKVSAVKTIVGDNCLEVIYIGDGFTDYYAMEYIKNNGGTVIFVYNDEDNKDISIMKEKNIVDLFTKADFSNDSELSRYVKKLCKIKKGGN